jgi:hypothetical protein
MTHLLRRSSLRGSPVVQGPANAGIQTERSGGASGLLTRHDIRLGVLLRQQPSPATAGLARDLVPVASAAVDYRMFAVAVRDPTYAVWDFSSST